jgi:cobalt/nickel transport system permease protein
MHHLVIESWAQRTSWLHLRDARAKVGALLLFLIAVATSGSAQDVLAGYFVLLLAAIAVAGLPVLSVLLRAAVVLPFSVTFALISWISGDTLHAVLLIEKSYLSGLAVVLLTSTTPLPAQMKALEKLGTPQPIVLTIQFLYRYLFVLLEQAESMRIAARCRGGLTRIAGAGILATLFQRSYEKANGIQRAMLARGFNGSFPVLETQEFRAADAWFLLLVLSSLLGLWLTH